MLPTLLGQLTDHWNGQLRPGLDSLTDDEYRWEPVAGAWSIRPRGEGTSPMAFGAGDAVVDYAWPPPDPAPITTIAWRIGHIGVGVLGDYAARAFRGVDLDHKQVRFPLDAAGGLALLDEHYERWVAGVGDLEPDRLGTECGSAVEGWEHETLGVLILHVHREVIHHGAEILLLRDLYRHRFG